MLPSPRNALARIPIFSPRIASMKTPAKSRMMISSKSTSKRNAWKTGQDSYLMPGIKNASPSSLALKSRAFRDTLYTSISKPQEFADSVYVSIGSTFQNDGELRKRSTTSGIGGPRWAGEDEPPLGSARSTTGKKNTRYVTMKNSVGERTRRRAKCAKWRVAKSLAF